MFTCYVFAQELDEERALSVCLDARGMVQAPLSYRSIEEIQALQSDSRTIVVLSSVHCALHLVELPWLNEKKARAALPYAIEDKLAQPVDELHVAFDRHHYRHNHYLTAVIDKAWLTKIIERLNALDIDFDAITLDWFALHEHETCLLNGVMLINSDTFKGALSQELFSQYQPDVYPNNQHHRFQNSSGQEGTAVFTLIDENLYTWIAQRLHIHEGINLCQGDFQHNTRHEVTTYWYWASGALMGIWLLIWMLIHGYQLIHLNHQIAELDTNIASIYHEFYPHDKHVISPQFRVQQKLGSASQEVFWPLLQKLTKAFHASKMTIQQLRFQNNTLFVTLYAEDFSALEQFENALQQQGIQVTQSSASSEKQSVVSTLELRL